MPYTRTTYSTSVSAAQLNNGEAGIEDVDARATALESGQVTQDTAITARAEKANLPLNLKDYGAVDGQNIDAALTALAAAMPTNGQVEIVVPRGSYTFSSWPSWDGKRGIIVRGESGLSGGAGPASKLVYSGTGAGSAISARSTVGVEFHNLELSYSSASFTGTLLDLSATGTKGSATGRGADTQLFVMRGCRLDGQRTANLIDLDNAIICNFYDTIFVGGLVGIRGKASSSTYSNLMQFFGCTFLGNVTVHVQNAGQNWSFFGCTFEQLYTAGGASAGAGALAYAGGATGNGVKFAGCYFGDANDTGSWVSFTGNGLSVDGCTFSHSAVAIATGSSTFGVAISGNDFTNIATAITLGANPAGVSITGNRFSSGITTAITAAASILGLSILGNDFGTTTPCVIDGTGAFSVMFFANDVGSAAQNSITYSAGGMPGGSFLQRGGGQMYETGIFQNAGAISDASFPATPPNGTWGVDTTNFQIYVRIGGVWKKTAALT